MLNVQLALDVIDTITNHYNGFNALSISYIPCLDYDAYIGNSQLPQTKGKLTHGFPPDGNYFFRFRNTGEQISLAVDILPSPRSSD